MLSEQLFEQGDDIVLIHGGVVIVVDFEVAHEVVLHTCLFFRCGGCRAYGQVGKHLSRVGIDDFGVQMFGNMNAGVGFADTCRTYDDNECFRCHLVMWFI